jgi:predicted nucleotidyltransferase
MKGIHRSKLGAVRAFCKAHAVRSLAVFGSRARGDAAEASDIDLLIEFEDGSGVSFLDLMAMRFELEEILGTRVDLVEKDALANPIRRARILSEQKPVYGA